MNRRHLLALSSALVAGSIAGCTADSNPPPTDGAEDSTDAPSDPGTGPGADESALADLVGATNEFAFDLYGELVAAEPAENLLASPVSVSTALAMAYAGARGETREQMREALRYALDDEALHTAFDALQRELNARGDDVDADDLPQGYDADDEPVPFRLELVNAVWGLAGYPFREAYLDLLETHYGGGLREVDYERDPEGAREEINAWVAEQTDDRIDDLLPEGSLDELTRLVLTNAVYFLANWHFPFDERRTDDDEFVALDGSTATVPLMEQEATLPYAEVDGTQAVDLPYVGEKVSMLAILPAAGEFEAFEESFDGAGLRRIVEALEARDGAVKLPRFEFESGFALREVLESLGMPIAFDQHEADFSGIAHLEETNENLYIDDVYHDTYIAVDEEGTEAAAATGVVIKAESAPADPFEFVADRPFLFVVRDRPTGAVLFVGRVVVADSA